MKKVKMIFSNGNAVHNREYLLLERTFQIVIMYIICMNLKFEE